MAFLVILKGPQAGKHFRLEGRETVLGRNVGAAVCLESQAVSRQHARVVLDDDSYFVEDLDSSNGTFLNGNRIDGRMPFSEQDLLQIGPYLFAMRQSPTPSPTEDSLIIRGQVEAWPSSHSLQGPDSAHKLKVVLEISQHLARTLDMDALLGKLLDQLMQLFPQADRSMVLLGEGDNLVVRCQRCRRPEDSTSYPYSRTIVKEVLADGIGILSEDIRSDQRFKASETLASLNLRSVLCVPLICQDGRRLGILQMDSFRRGSAFRIEDLQLLTVVGLQVAVVLENASMHAEILREERLRQELALAREIQQGFLPTEFPVPADAGYELYAHLNPAREVAGDLYDFFPTGDNLAFLVGDVSGKGMPAALFMVAVRTLGRHVATGSQSPTQTLRQLNAALAADNPSAMFVTLAHGIYTPATGELVLASGGHPLPLLRRNNGQVDVVAVQSGRLLGYNDPDLRLKDTRLTLGRGETLIMYTDGFTEAVAGSNREMFGDVRLREALSGPRTGLPLKTCADQVSAAVRDFTGSQELQDDQTLFMLRRV